MSESVYPITANRGEAWVGSSSRTVLRGRLALALMIGLTAPPVVAKPTPGVVAREATQSASDKSSGGESALAASTSVLPEGIDPGPVKPWYEARSQQFALNPGASADDLRFTINLLEFVVGGDEVAWERMSEMVEHRLDDEPTPLVPALLKPDKELAARYHAAAEPLIHKPKEERDTELEERLYRKALLANPADPDLYNHVSIAHSLRKEFVAAGRYAKLAIAVDPAYLPAYQELAYVYKNAAQYQDCIALAEHATNIDGDLRTKALILARKGQAHWMLKQEEQALSAFATAKRLGAPGWIQSYLDGEQTLGEEYKIPSP